MANGISLEGRIQLNHFNMAPLGTLVVFSMVYPSFVEYGGTIDNYFWADAASPQGEGPFQTLHECMEHYKRMAQGWKEPEAGELIRIDFRRKTRVE